MIGTVVHGTLLLIESGANKKSRAQRWEKWWMKGVRIDSAFSW